MIKVNLNEAVTEYVKHLRRMVASNDEIERQKSTDEVDALRRIFPFLAIAQMWRYENRRSVNCGKYAAVVRGYVAGVHGSSGEAAREIRDALLQIVSEENEMSNSDLFGEGSGFLADVRRVVDLVLDDSIEFSCGGNAMTHGEFHSLVNRVHASAWRIRDRLAENERSKNESHANDD